MITFKNFLKNPDLKKQVQKGSVAAGKKPRLELGVVGLSIGQTQSTGDTSIVREFTPIPMPELAAKKEIDVRTLISRLRASGFSKDQLDRIYEILNDRRPDDTLALREIDQLAALANVDPVKLRGLLSVSKA